MALLTAGSYESEICCAEQLRTLRKGNRLIPLLATAGADRPIYLEARQYREFSDPGSYDQLFQQLLADIHGDVHSDAARKLSGNAGHVHHCST